jgi:YgiT-type zinc finger domain-containing protein
MMIETQSKDQRYPCQNCHAGHVSIQHITYFTWLSGELITVPDFPAWVCDMCGLREYDQRALSWLNIILSPDTGRKKPAAKQPVSPSKRTAIQPDI